ncbi:DUF6688 domain-containing protein [Winogradskyella costae]|uniref:DUF6688 domain-containing protein n=1 Tax=Winogradskyella costae TaxID=2697008 RepID=UPI0015C6A3D0|nr:DUF6688 family protein [Winogradskyella costae]
MFPIVLIIIIPFCFVLFNGFYYAAKGKIKTSEKGFKIIQLWTVLLVPTFFIVTFDVGKLNDCCADSALFSPDHSIGMYILLIVYTVWYSISIFRKRIFPPLVELFLNSFLVLGLIINVLLCFHIHNIDIGLFLWVFGNLPIIILLLIELAKNQKIITQHIEQNRLESHHIIGRFSITILKLKPIYKYPIVTLLLVPVLITLSLFLLIFGQKPDSLISAFTQTYKHGFSQLDYMCDNVSCGGHFLCSVGANGHQSIVKPIRYGERNGHKIICNRQLLVANAFEDLIQDRHPKLHKIIRKGYNKVGDQIHKHYHIFNIKLVSDSVYILMKPLEILFLGVLYTCDKYPENRIAMQYVSKADRQELLALKPKST